MRRVLRLFPIILLAALIAVAAFCLALPAGVAHALATPVFRIVAKSATEWSLSVSLDGEEESVAQETGVFFEAGRDGVVADLFMDQMHDWLREHGFALQNRYIQFELPGFEAQFHGDDTVDYDAQHDGNFSLSATVESAVDPAYGTSAMDGKLQYRLKDSGGYADNDNYYGTSANAGDPIFFGRVAAGEYFVRYVAYEHFDFDGENFEVPRYSNNEFPCTVRKSVAPLPSTNSASVEYGVAAKDIYVEDGTGRWIFDDEQDGVSADSFLEVSDSPHIVYFDYVSNDVNYLPREHVPVSVTVTPRLLRVYVGDAHSLKGEPQADLTKIEYIVEALVEGDAEEDLGLEFYLVPQEFDPDRAGVYGIYARISDKNYECYTVSLHHTAVDSGIYTVYQNKYEATAADGRKFFAYCDALPAGVTFVVETADVVRVQGDILEGARDFYFESVAAYRMCFYDSLHNRVLPAGSYGVEWEGRVSGATYMAILGAGAAVGDRLTPYDGGANEVVMDDGADVVAFFKEVTIYPAENVWTWFNILLTALCACLLVAAVALAAAISKRRRRTWR